MLYSSISGEEYEKISCYKTSKEIWNKLEVTYKRNEKVKQTLVSLLVSYYELFKKRDKDSIEEIFVKFDKIIDELKAAGETYPVADQIIRILKSLPP